MMKMIFFMIFMTPLCLVKKGYWLNQIFYFFMVFLFFFHFSFSSEVLNLSFVFGCDLLSFSLVLLSLWICSLMIMASGKLFLTDNYCNIFLLVILFLVISLFLTFSTLNLFVFYLFFEMSLVPTLILILGWGYQPERLQAGVYLLFYTLFASLPMMLSIFYIYNYFFSLIFFSFLLLILCYCMFCTNMVFFIKIPMFFVHLWLPKAHVEAPVSGSMILAGIMLKLGGYGLMRLMSIFLTVGVKVNYFFILISMMGGLIISLVCLRQSDIKLLIAYSSVAHMGLVLSGILTMNYWGFCGSFLMMIAHGLCSSGLFCLANISYERLMSRSIYLNKGLMNLMPSMSLWWFLFCSCNMAAPPSLNLMGEIMLFNSLIGWSFKLMFFLIFISFFSAAYSLYLYSFTQHGKIYSGMYSFSNGYIREYLLLFLHWIPLNILILKSDFMVLWL
uniref:NADH-ubiquinone oxidoreductase chain 4 n=1 Tax=Byrrhus sp. MJTNT-2012 TaxID=1131599 RepID=H6W8L7_9COLE|nr:NADH dehydrogenase subunit 4 [Byrrhus sp. MJTNT-2012]